MARLIRMTEEHISQISREFNEALKGMKLSDGKITYSKTLGMVERKAELFFTEEAYLKMLTLVREFDKEVAWHGIAKRGDDPTKDEYIISDILVYPQEVTGATVTTDQERYQMWLMQHEDEIFNNIRMQGHSHVNMGTSPSSVDNALYDRILEQLEGDMFYIFLIWNKRDEKTIKIYDLKKNILFETADVKVTVLDDGYGMNQFLSAAKGMVRDKTYEKYQSQSYVNSWKKHDIAEKDKSEGAKLSEKPEAKPGSVKKKKKKKVGKKVEGNYSGLTGMLHGYDNGYDEDDYYGGYGYNAYQRYCGREY